MKLLDALAFQNQGRPPVWLMRQAGRFLPQYHSYKAKKRLAELFRDPQAIVEITKQPVDYLGVDAAILFSDILIILDAFGIDYDFDPSKGPVISNPCKELGDYSIERLSFVFESIRRLRKELNVPLIGFTGGPFTVASYLIEGGTSREFKRVKEWLYNDPNNFRSFLKKLACALASFADMQAEAGVQAIQIFDSWAGILGYDEFCSFVIPALEEYLNLRKYNTPVMLFMRGSAHFAPQLSQLPITGISVDWQGNMPHLRQSLRENLVLQGNLDPSILYGSYETIASAADRLLDSMKDDPGYIFNLGHGVLPDLDPLKVKFLIDRIKAR